MHKPASQFPDTYLKGSATKAVDGSTGDSVYRGMCAHTDWGNPAWWRVDLEANYNLTGIQIYNRNKNG